MDAGRGVIFDMDGVLVDSAKAHRKAWQKLGEETGAPFSAELFERTFGQRNASIIPAWRGETSTETVEELGERKERLYRDMVQRGEIRIYHRARDLILELRAAGAAIAVASSGPRQNVALLVEKIGAAALVDATVAAEDVREGKPHPEVFLAAAARLGLDPKSCAVIEDSVHGIEAAKRAGMLAVAVLTSTPRQQLVAAGADIVVPEVGALSAASILGNP